MGRWTVESRKMTGRWDHTVGMARKETKSSDTAVRVLRWAMAHGGWWRRRRREKHMQT